MMECTEIKLTTAINRSTLQCTLYTGIICTYEHSAELNEEFGYFNEDADSSNVCPDKWPLTLNTATGDCCRLRRCVPAIRRVYSKRVQRET